MQKQINNKTNMLFIENCYCVVSETNYLTINNIMFEN